MTAAAPRAGARLDGVLFDIDDTLVDTRGAFRAAFEVIAHRYLPELPPDRLPEVLATWRADASGHYRAYTRGETGHREQRMARANELHALFGGPELDDAAFEAWDQVFEGGFTAAWAAHPEASAVIDHLLAAGLQVGALSNAHVAYQTDKLARTGFLDRVPMLVGIDTLGIGKPDASVFLEACRLLGTEAARTAYVGDELDVDAVAAAEAGLLGVWVDRPGGRRVPVSEQQIADADVLVIHSLAELPEALGV